MKGAQKRERREKKEKKTAIFSEKKKKISLTFPNRIALSLSLFL